MQGTELGRFGAVNVDFLARDRTLGRRQLQRLRINGDSYDPFRHHEGLDIAVCGQSHRTLHEIGPYPRGSIGSGKPQVSILVESNTDYAKQIRAVARKPTVARSGCFARSTRGKPASAHWCAS